MHRLAAQTDQHGNVSTGHSRRFRKPGYPPPPPPPPLMSRRRAERVKTTWQWTRGDRPWPMGGKEAQWANPCHTHNIESISFLVLIKIELSFLACFFIKLGCLA
jgi:hypothetical protein